MAEGKGGRTRLSEFYHSCAVAALLSVAGRAGARAPCQMHEAPAQRVTRGLQLFLVAAGGRPLRQL